MLKRSFSPKPCTEGRFLRGAIRGVIDMAAIGMAWVLEFSATGSFAAAFIVAAAVGLYGVWCFYDGSA